MDGPRAFIIGYPVAHSRSPMVHGFWLRELGLAGSYEKVAVAPGDLPAFLAGFRAQGFVGGNITLPHKEATFAALDRVTDHARRLGAVNTIWTEPDGRLTGHNTDGHGYVAALDEDVGPGWERGVATALVLGAGGAARAVVCALLDRGIGRIVVANRTSGRAEGLRVFAPDRIDVVGWEAITGLLSTTDLLVNTTSLGMTGQPGLDVDPAGLPPAAIVSDLVYVPLETPLLARARARGLRINDGLGMLLHQAVPGFAAWFGRTPRVTPRLRALVAADLEPAPTGSGG